MRSSVTARRLVRRAAPGFVGWTIALCVFVLLFGAEAVARAAGTLADPVAVPLVVLGVGATVCWGASLWRTLTGIGTPIHPFRAVGLFFAATFINGVTPFGQMGGDAVSAVLVERVTGADYESGLAAILSVTGVNRLVSVLVVGVGGVLYLRTTPDRVETVALGVPASVDLGVVAVGAMLVGVGVVGTVQVLNAAGTSSWTSRPSRWLRARGVNARARAPAIVRRRLDGAVGRTRRFKRAVGRTLTDPTTVGTVVAFGLLGELVLGATLWGTLSLLDATAPLSLALVAVPLSRVGAITPTPGGAGGVEVALAGLLVALGGVAAPVAGVAALAFRLLTFAVPTVVGGGVVALVLTRG